MNTAINKLLAVATAEIGYLEKKTNAQLDHPTANAGDNNWTKYARDLDALGLYIGKKNGYAWCDMFVDWCFVTAFGLDVALTLTCQPKPGYGAGCTSSANYYKQKGRFFKSGPQPGDQIFFTKDGGKTMYHTGIVVKVEGGKVYTIEGNTSSASGVIANGGCVRQKSYSINYARIGGYGRPDWTLVGKDTTDPNAPAEWAKTAWEKAKTKKGLGGNPIMDGSRPWDSITRQEVAVILDRLGLLG